MQISDLLRYRDDLLGKIDQLSLGSAIAQDCHLLDDLLSHHLSNTTFTKLQQERNKYNDITDNFNSIKNALENIIIEINNIVDEQSSARFNQTTIEFFNGFHAYDFIIDQNVDNVIQAYLQKHADHFYPALQFGCPAKSKSLTGNMVANDPLYLCDFNQENIDNVSNQFNDIYNKRLRKYVLTSHELHQLPHNQFGFIFSWMMFNYANFATVQHYLERMIRLLRPGGHFIFSYNNCDLLESCLQAESGGMSYVSKRQLLKSCEKFGYEVVSVEDISNNDYHVKYISIIEIKKPGTLSTVKRRQVMGAIHQK